MNSHQEYDKGHKMCNIQCSWNMDLSWWLHPCALTATANCYLSIMLSALHFIHSSVCFAILSVSYSLKEVDGCSPLKDLRLKCLRNTSPKIQYDYELQVIIVILRGQNVDAFPEAVLDLLESCNGGFKDHMHLNIHQPSPL